MNLSELIVYLAMPLAFAINGIIFFKKGKHSVKWLLTLLPFILNLVFLILYYTQHIPSLLPHENSLAYIGNAIGIILNLIAIGLFTFTIGSHRTAIPMWHQKEDLPTVLVTWGPYHYVRHPFYTSYILYFIGLILGAPSWPIMVTSLYAFYILNYTAQTEEKELLNSPYGIDYRTMVQRTGRFFPRLSIDYSNIPKTNSNMH